MALCTAAFVGLVLAASPIAAGTGDAEGALLKALTDSDVENLQEVLSVLSATGDEQLAPVFIALSRSPDPRRRQLAAAALVGLLEKDAATVLLERLKSDPSADVRRQAIGHLIALDAIADEDLLEAMGDDDERIRCLAACRLAGKSDDPKVAAVLDDLTSSTDAATANLARIGLLAAGDSAQLAPLREAMENQETSDPLKQLMLEQIRRGEVSAAGRVVAQLARGASNPLKIEAYKTYAAISPDAATVIAGAINESQDLVLRTQLLGPLADLPDARAHLGQLAGADDALGVLVRFELARAEGGAKAAAATTAAMKLGHPIVVDAVLRRARADVDANGAEAGFYTDALLRYIRSVEPNPRQIGIQHTLAAGAVAILADLGAPDAMDGLAEILSGRYSAISRVVGAGLLQSRNPDACRLMRPFLASAYDDAATDAALVLGYFADPAASEGLERILKRHSQRPGLAALAGWYLLKISGQARSRVAAIAGQIN